MRYPTAEYKTWLIKFNEVCSKFTWCFEKDEILKLKVDAYFSNKAADLDNVCKPVQDALQTVFNFNDKYFYKVRMNKYIVPKGEERTEIWISKTSAPVVPTVEVQTV